MNKENVNLYPILYDLLYCYRNGSRILFDKLFNQSLIYCQLDLDLNKRKKLGRIIYKRLCDFCVIESIKTESTNKWLLNEASLIEKDDNEYIVLGNSRFIQQLSQSYSSSIKYYQSVFEKMICYGVTFEISLPVMELSPDEGKRISRLEGIKLVSNDYRLDWQLWPDINTAQGSLTELSNPEILRGEHQVEHFNFQKFGWNIGNNEKDLATGYYRIRDKFMTQIYLIVFNSGLGLTALQTRYFDWGFFIAASKLGLYFKLTYICERSILAIPVKLFSVMPLLFRRAILLQSFRWPEYGDSQYQFDKISIDMIHQIQKSYPGLKIELK